MGAYIHYGVGLMVCTVQGTNHKITPALVFYPLLIHISVNHENITIIENTACCVTLLISTTYIAILINIYIITYSMVHTEHCHGIEIVKKISAIPKKKSILLQSIKRIV